MSDAIQCVSCGAVSYNELGKTKLHCNGCYKRLQNSIDEISGYISAFKIARNTTKAIDAIGKMVVWNVEHEERLAKKAREEQNGTQASE